MSLHEILCIIAAYIIGALTFGLAIYYIQRAKIKQIKRAALIALRNEAKESAKRYHEGYSDASGNAAYFQSLAKHRAKTDDDTVLVPAIG